MTSSQLNLFVIRGFATLLVAGTLFATFMSMITEGHLLKSTQTLLVGLPCWALILRYGFTGRTGIPRGPGKWWQIAYGGSLIAIALALLLVGNLNGFEKMASLIVLLGGMAMIAYSLFAPPRAPSAA